MWSTSSRAEPATAVILAGTQQQSRRRDDADPWYRPDAGRLVGFAAAAFAMVLMAKPGHELFRYVFFSGGLTWAGIIPVVFALRICVAGWVAWAVLRFDGRGLMRALLAAFGVSFLLLYGWYYLLLGMDDVLFYWIVTGDFLYLAAGLLAGSASILSARTRGGESHA